MKSLDLDSDISVEVRKGETKAVTPSEIRTSVLDDTILPIPDPDKGIVLKRLEDTTNKEFVDWVNTVMPLSPEMTNAFVAEKGSKTANKAKKMIFETIVMWHARRWLFGADSPMISSDTRWN
jgi:hypothetical protein